MRTELELIEKIENYLQGKLSAAEKIEFEKEIQSDPSLQMEVDAQKEVANLIDRVSLKKVSQTAYSQYRFRKNIFKWSLNGLVIVILILGINYVSEQAADGEKNAGSSGTANKKQYTFSPPQKAPSLNSTNNNSGPTNNANGEQEKKIDRIKNDKTYFSPDRLKDQIFLINNKRDTMVRTKSGMMLTIPKNIFIGDGYANGPVKLDIKEAFNKIDMIKAGLTTMNNNTILESGGMFNLNVTTPEDKPLNFAVNKGINIAIPQKMLPKKMNLYDGVPANAPRGANNRIYGVKGKDPQGRPRINWIDPRPMEFIAPKVLVHVNNRIVTDTFGFFQPVVDPKEDPKKRKKKKPTDASAIYTEKKDNDFCYCGMITKISTWTNCDIPWLNVSPNGTMIELTASIENVSDFKNVDVCLVFGTANVLIPGTLQADNTFRFSLNGAQLQMLPEGETITLIANTGKNGTCYFSRKKLMMKKNEIVSLKLKAMTEDEINEELKKEFPSVN